MRYIPFNKGLKKILKNAIRPVELQKRMDSPAIVIGIEVKYRSSLSSEDTEEDESISAENSLNQLSREARGFRQVGADKKKLLLLPIHCMVWIMKMFMM